MAIIPIRTCGRAGPPVSPLMMSTSTPRRRDGHFTGHACSWCRDEVCSAIRVIRVRQGNAVPTIGASQLVGQRRPPAPPESVAEERRRIAGAPHILVAARASGCGPPCAGGRPGGIATAPQVGQSSVAASEQHIPSTPPRPPRPQTPELINPTPSLPHPPHLPHALVAT